jgi:hypothetical protein
MEWERCTNVVAEKLYIETVVEVAVEEVISGEETQ